MSYNPKHNCATSESHLSETASLYKEETMSEHTSFLLSSLSFSDNKADSKDNIKIEINAEEDYAKRVRACFMLEESQVTRDKAEQTVDSLMVQCTEPLQVYVKIIFNNEVQAFINTHGNTSSSQKTYHELFYNKQEELYELFHRMTNELLIKDSEIADVTKLGIFTDMFITSDILVRLLYRFARTCGRIWNPDYNKDYFCKLFCEIAKKSFHKIPNIDSLMASIAPYLSKVEIEQREHYFGKAEVEELLIACFKNLEYELRHSDFSYFKCPSITTSQRRRVIKKLSAFAKEMPGIKQTAHEKHSSIEHSTRSPLIMRTNELLILKNILIDNAYKIFGSDIISHSQLSSIMSRALRISVAESQKHSLYFESVSVLKELIQKADKKDIASIALCALLFE